MPTMEHLSPKSLVKSAACPLRPGEITDYDLTTDSKPPLDGVVLRKRSRRS